LLRSDPRVAPWTPVGVVGLTLFRNPRKTPNGVATCHAAHSVDVLGFGAVGTSVVGGPFRWVLAHSIGAGRPVLARRAAPKRTTKRWTRLKAVWTIGFRFDSGSPRRLELDRPTDRVSKRLVLSSALIIFQLGCLTATAFASLVDPKIEWRAPSVPLGGGCRAPQIQKLTADLGD
jgi:hypothetical protein